MNYWLLKSEPDCYSIDDLKHDKVEPWDGIRNYQARNNMRAMKKGDVCFFYHSNTKEPGIVGLCKVVSKEAYPDPTQFIVKEDHYDPKSDPDNPRWDLVDVRFVKKFKEPLTLKQIKADEKFADMMLIQKRGMRLSVQPVTKQEYELVMGEIS